MHSDYWAGAPITAHSTGEYVAGPATKTPLVKGCAKTVSDLSEMFQDAQTPQSRWFAESQDSKDNIAELKKQPLFEPEPVEPPEPVAHPEDFQHDDAESVVHPASSKGDPAAVTNEKDALYWKLPSWYVIPKKHIPVKR